MPDRRDFQAIGSQLSCFTIHGFQETPFKTGKWNDSAPLIVADGNKGT